MTHLCNSHRAAHCPEMRVCQNDINRLRFQRVSYLSPVCGNHIGSCWESCPSAEFTHDLSSRVHSFRTAWIFTVCKNPFHALYVFYRFLKKPAAVWIQINPCVRDFLFQRPDYIHLFISRQHSAFQFKIFESVLLMCCFCKRDNLLRGQRFFMTDPVPFTVRVRFLIVREICLFAVPYKEQVAQHPDLVPLLSVSQKLTDRNSEHLSEKIQTRCFDRGQHMDSRPQIEGLVSSYIFFSFGIQISFHL